FLQSMKGPDFLFLYAVWFVITFGSVLLLRWRGYDNTLVTLTGLGLFAGLGLARYLVGSFYGMHKWSFLFLVMFIRALCFLIRLQQNGRGSSDGSSWWSSCSSGGGCGGGGCGGGGCGGCGGG